ncbi:MAG: hypothetical protein KC563_11245 [Nitrospira sp.]|nr:hypothetical protein [Nitrospira sp.]MCA9465083.1 hypothetical protein [Nitrospira sp.]MCA9476358.1 hypothetical protein [Nitrospira sp.]MCB9712045.1 hypothetical protein [Nitrospiraceae bacterium]HQU27547.1 hypothetical protein [Nitrospirales bacterium]
MVVLVGLSGVANAQESVSPVSNAPALHPNPSSEGHPQGFSPSIQTMAVTPEGTLYAGSFGMGIFRSVDQGQSWEMWNVGLLDPFLLCLVFRPPDSIYAGTVRGGVFRLKLGDSRWESVQTGLEQTEVRSLMVHRQHLFAGTGTGVFRWDDASQRWSRLGKGLKQILVAGLAMLDDRTLLAATAGKGLFRFDIEGPFEAKWVDFESVFVDPKERLPHRYLRVIAVNSQGNIFLGTQNGGMFRSRNAGQTWEPIGRRLPNDSIRSIVPLSEDILVGTGNGIFRWVQAQRQWIPLNKGLHQKSIQTLLVTPTHEVYAGTSSGAFRSQDGEGNWVDVSHGFGMQTIPQGPYQ